MNILHILQVFLISQLIDGQEVLQTDTQQSTHENIYKLTLDDQISQILNIYQSLVNNVECITIFAEKEDQSLMMLRLRLDSTLINNEVRPDFEIIEKFEINQITAQQWLQSFQLGVNETFVIYIHEKQILVDNIYSSENIMSFTLNYFDPIITISVSLSDYNFLAVYINIHLTNWSVQLFDLQNEQQSPQIIQYDSIELGGIKSIVCSNSISYLLTENGVIYQFENSKKPGLFLEQQKNEQIIDIALFFQDLIILKRINNTCSLKSQLFKIYNSSFDCFTNDLQLSVLNPETIFVIQNHTSILYLFNNQTFALDQKLFMVAFDSKILLTYGDYEYISVQFVEGAEQQKIIEYNEPKENQQEIKRYELNSSFLNSNILLNFQFNDYLIFNYAPYLFNIPFTVKVIKDEYSIINKVDFPIYEETCLQITQTYQFLKFIKRNQYIYQANNYDVYFVGCSSKKIQVKQLLRSNQQVIKFFTASLHDTVLSIYFDDRNGLEFYVYKYSEMYDFLDSQEHIFSSSINRIQKYNNQIIIQHLDLSYTVIEETDTGKYFHYNQSIELERFQFVGKINNYLICTTNSVTDAMSNLFLFDFISFQMINRYHITNITILDLVIMPKNQFILILKSSINQSNYLNQYQFVGGRIIFLRELPLYNMSPQRIIDGFEFKFMIFCVNNSGDPFVLAYDFSKNSSECLFKYFPHPKEQFWLSRKSLYILEDLELDRNISNRIILKYPFNSYYIQIKETYQKRFIQNYNVTLQLDNLINQDQVILRLTCYDQTEQLIVQKQDVPIQQLNKFQKVNFNEYIYGPIDSVRCVQNCILNTFAHLETTYSINIYRNIKNALIIGNYLFLIQSKYELQLQILQIVNSTLSEIKVVDLKSSFGRFVVIQKLVDPKLINELIAVIDFQSQKMENITSIQVYSYDSEFTKVCQLQLKSIDGHETLKIKDNIILNREPNQLTLYQYNFEINKFESVIIDYQHQKERVISQDYKLNKNDFYYAFMTDQLVLKIIVIDLPSKQVKFDNEYQLEIDGIDVANLNEKSLQIMILQINDNLMTILYFRFTEPMILHIQRDDLGFSKIHTQQLIIQYYHIAQVSLVYYDEKKIIFNMLKVNDEESHEIYLSQLYLINRYENFTFPSYSLDSINFILPYGDNQLVFINNTDIGFIQIFDSYEIKVIEESFQIEVSNFVSTINVKMNAVIEKNTHENELIAKITLTLSIIGLLFLIFWFYLRRNRLKYQNIK